MMLVIVPSYKAHHVRNSCTKLVSKVESVFLEGPSDLSPLTILVLIAAPNAEMRRIILDDADMLRPTNSWGIKCCVISLALIVPRRRCVIICLLYGASVLEPL